MLRVHPIICVAATAVLLGAFPVTSWLFLPAHGQQPFAPDIALPKDPVAIRWKDYRVLSEPDQKRLGKIQLSIYSRYTVTDADLDFALNLLKAEPVVPTGNNKLVLQCMVLTDLVGRKDFTKPQVERFLQAVTPLAYRPNSTVAGYAAIALGGLRTAQVIPVLEKIVRSTPDPQVRSYAAKNLPRLKQLAASGEI